MKITGSKLGFLGGGAMAEALIAGIVKQELLPCSQIAASDPNQARLSCLQKKYSVVVLKDNRELVNFSDIIILAVKPFVVDKILSEVKDIFKPGKLLISIAAGLKTAYLEELLDAPVPVVRVMPNTPALIGSGMSAVAAGKYADEIASEKTLAIFKAVGKAVMLAENLLDIVTGLSGSGPAYMYLILEALSDAGVRMGLPRDTATLLSAQTMIGAAGMLIETGEHAAVLKERVTTPGGTTAAGLFALEEAGVRTALMKAVEAATVRSRELSGR
ncbi:pyrroline-5-carboxylate reductase [Desulfofarcimen acetoxidans DSM 771]|uniref:Pyrroline-5-carboxylate reductase n=1 Tax=Desulfofarcimen acetoxidans (strain ATCC 49208 / DSM 771 / KCTC 5769 / VKM B-1644 / 5575) TaxID=485916 RepID=C8W4A2_DESAS|nr:pyrroline-5-carboxylate reductase [Desulfofarcimen acetoxidans]ACV61970.1 pyrroline-5-carboxylate reductase [Desulfofarcimen acetoxidans DSM 771]